MKKKQKEQKKRMKGEEGGQAMYIGVVRSGDQLDSMQKKDMIERGEK
jgi:hypothetical protein